MRNTLWIVLGLLVISLGGVACSNSSSHFNGDLDIEDDSDQTETDEVDTDGDMDSEADSDSEDDLEEIDTDVPTLIFPDAVEGWSTTYAQDADTDAAGMQLDIRVQAAEFPVGTYITLEIGGVSVANATLTASNVVVFPKVTLSPGANVLNVSAHASATDKDILASANATLTLKGCRLVFVKPAAQASLSDSGPNSDCKTSCGDDLDCGKPNLQYDVKVAVENVAAPNKVELNVAGVKTQVAATDGVATFAQASLPNGVSLALQASADLGEGQTCEVLETISVSVTCSCHLTLDPQPKDAYNAQDTDDDTEAAGFQKKFTVSSDNCADGSRVHVNLDGIDTPVVLADGKADFTLTLSETAQDVSHTLSLSIVEVGTGREGEAGPYSFRVDRTAPSIDGLTVNDLALDETKIYTIQDDLNQNLEGGVQLKIGGALSGVENDQKVTFKYLAHDGDAAFTVVDAYAKGELFSIPSVTFAKPTGYTTGPVSFDLQVETNDAAGNPAVALSKTLQITFEQPTILLTKIAGRDAASNMPLNLADDADTELAGIQIDVLADTVLLPIDTEVGLQIGSARPIIAKVETGGVVSWRITLTDGAQTLKAGALLGTYAVASEPLTVVMNALAPSIAFVPGDGSYAIDGAWIKGDTVSFKVSSDAGEGRPVTLSLGGATIGSPVPLDAQGFATFTDVGLSKRKFAALSIKASVSNVSGNTGSAEITLYRDTQTPVIAVSLVGTSPLNTNENIVITLAVTEDALAEMSSPKAKLELFDTTQNPARSLGKVDVPIDAGGAGSHSYAFIANGSYRAVATLSDKAGNAGTGQTEFAVDTPCYTVSITAPPAGSLYGASAAVGGDVSKGVCVPISITTDAPSATSTANLYIDGSTSVRAICVVSGGGCSFQDSVCGAAGVNFAEGSHQFQVKVTNGTTTCGSNLIPLRVDFTAPTLTLVSPAPADPIVLNKLSDTNPGAAFTVALDYVTETSEEGRSAQLTILNGTTEIGLYNAVVDAEGKIRFPLVDLTGLGLQPEGTLLTLRLTLTDEAGNTGSKDYTALVDQSAPTFVEYKPKPGLLNRSLDADSTTPKVFDLYLEVQVRGAEFGKPLQVSVVGDTTEAPVVTSSNVTQITDPSGINDLGRAFLTGKFTKEDGYTFKLIARDANGNTTESPDLYYTIKFTAEVHLQSWDNLFLENTSATWLLDNDQDKVDPGYTIHVKAQTIGFATGAWISLCSDKTLYGGATLGACKKDPSYNIVAKSQVVGGSVAYFSAVNLTNETTHNLFVEGVDSANNEANSKDWGLFTVTLDSLRPTIAANGIVIAQNNVANDKSDRVVLKANEGTPAGTSLKVTVTVTLAAGVTDGKNADLFLNNSSLTGNLPVTIVNNAGTYTATFTNITLPNGMHSETGALIARVWDQKGNVSDDAKSALNVEVDTIAPKISFVDPDGTPLYQSSCSNKDNAADCLYTVALRIEKQAGEASSFLGGVVTLSLGSTTRQFTLDENSASQIVEFSDFPIPQGSQNLGVVVADPAGNEGVTTRLYTVDSQAPTVSIGVPASDPSYTAADNDDTHCGDGGGLNDSLLRRCDWTMELASALNHDATIQLEWRYLGETDFRPFSNGGANWAAIMGGSSTHAVNALDFRRNLSDPTKIEVRTRSLEATTQNEWVSPTVQRTVSLSFPLYMQLFAIKNDTSAKLLSGSDILGADYAGAGTTGASFIAHITVQATDTLNGQSVELLVNDVSVGSAAISGGSANFPSVPFVQGPARNTLTGRVVSSSSSTTLTNILADSVAPSFSFTQPAVGAVVNYNYGQSDSDGQHGNGIVPKGTYIPTVTAANPAEVYNTYVDGEGNPHTTSASATLKATDPNGNAVALGGTITASFDSNGVAKFSAVRLPNARTAGGSPQALTLTVVATDLAGNAGALSGGSPQIRVDDDQPKDIANLKACLGSASGSGSIELEPAGCNTLCGSDTTKCDRRAGKALLAWTVPAADTVTSTGTAPSAYEVHWVEKANTETPCAGLEFASVANSPTGGVVTVTTPLAAVGGTQTAVLTNLNVNLDTDYCFFVRATDELGNRSLTDFASSSTTAKTQRSVRLGNAMIEKTLSNTTGLGSMLRVGDFNNDGLADYAISDWQANGNRGRVYIYYGQTPFAAEPTVADAGWTAHGLRLEGEAAGDRFGNSFDIGDLNGDGYDDLAVGAPWADPIPDNFGDGRVYVYFGSASGISATPSLIFKPTPLYGGGWGQLFGQAVEILDFDKNTNGPAPAHRNCKALAISTNYTENGDIYLLRGRADWSALGYTFGYIQDQADLHITRPTDVPMPYLEFLGRFMAAGYFDDDDKEDLLMGQIDFDYDGTTDTVGHDRAWVVWGGYTGATLTLSAGSPYDQKLDSPTGNYASDWSYTLFGIPSTSGGTRSEALIADEGGGKYYYYTNLTNPASAIVLGPFPTMIDPDRPWASTAGDFNHDGKNDAVLSYLGDVYLYWGSTNGLTIDGKTKLTTLGSDSYRVIGGGDFNGDGYPDLLLTNLSTKSISILY